MLEAITPDEVHSCISAILPELPSDPSLNLLECQLIDSYSIIELVDLLEQAFSVRFGPTDLSFDNLMTVAAMTSTVNRLRAAAS